ncbi:MAG: AsnC family transcriptional regulator [Thermodesulfobacteriota bacterium]
MDDIDRKILAAIQSEFPLSPRPYRDLSDRLGVPETDIFNRVTSLKKKGIIRRIGGSFDAGSLGFVTTLCAAKVPEERITVFAEVVNRYPGVTHNYLRDHEYNIWFTLMMKNKQELERVIEEIMQSTGIREIITLPAKKTYKLLIDFSLG